MMPMAQYLRLRQVCLVAADLPKAEADIQAVLGCQPCHRDPAVAKYGLENVLYPIGQDLLEIVAPTEPDTAAGRFLDRSAGRGGYMVIMDCSDLGRRRERVEALRIRIANELRYPGFSGIQLHPKDGRAAIIEFNWTEGGENRRDAYHPAGPDWPGIAARPATSHLVSVDVASPRPQELASHWGRILDVPVHPGERPFLRLEDQVIWFSADNERSEALVGLEIALSDRRAAIEIARNRGLSGSGGAVSFCGVRLTLTELSQRNRALTYSAGRQP
jgi:hypothetical protein